MKPKHLLILSILAGLLAVVLVQLQLRKEKGAAVVVFRATESVKAGEALGTRFEKVTLPGGNLFPGLLKEAPTGEMEELVRNTPLREPIQAGEIVYYRHLEATVDAGIRPEIPSGHRAVSIAVSEESSVSYMVQPGDVVDVLAALPMRVERVSGPEVLGAALGGANVALETKPLLQGVTVLAVGSRTRRSQPEGRGRDAAYTAVTLLVTLEEAQKLAYARDVLDSPMTLVLRSPEDDSKESAVRAVSLVSPDFDRIGNRPQTP